MNPNIIARFNASPDKVPNPFMFSKEKSGVNESKRIEEFKSIFSLSFMEEYSGGVI